MNSLAPASDSTADEPRLAQQAAAGDGEAFAELYERYERRAYNLCYRILGSEDDAADATQEAFVGLLRRLPSLEGRDLAFGSYLFTSARNACYDLIDRRRRAEPSEEIPESSIPVGGGVGGGGFGFDPGDPGDDPERNVLLDARQEEIRAANATLPERQREALALKEIEELSYDEIAAIMDMNRNSVAQLISRARINLRDALRGSALASITASSPECEQALALLAARQDGQAAKDAAWLELHLHECETCRLGREAMEEAGVSYRAWLPIAAAPVLFRETMAEAAEAVGADWSAVTARRDRTPAPGSRLSRPRAQGLGLGGSSPVLAHRRRDLVLIGILALALVAIVFAGATGDDAPPTAALPASEEEPATVAKNDENPAADAKPKDKPGGGKEKKGGGDGKPGAAGPADEPGQKDEKDEKGDEGGEKTSDEPSARQAGSRRPEQRARRSGAGEPRRGSGGAGGDPGGVNPPGRTTDPPARTTNPDPPGGSDPPPPPPPDRPDPPSDPPVRDDPPPPPPPEEPPTRVPGCRDAAGVPIPCGTPPRTPRRPPPRLAPP